ncbi:MAG: STAS domain-containing protein [Candidatus Aminicenantes bacterium]|nr:STAS domain-containing protein [Candidatus Aminicenantes bacterium]
MVITKREQGNVVILDLEGEIRRSDTTSVSVHQHVKEQLDAGKRDLLLNFDKVPFIDSFGIGEILASYISTQNIGGRLKLTGISKRLLLVFQVTQLTRVLDIQDNEEKALASFLKG